MESTLINKGRDKVGTYNTLTIDEDDDSKDDSEEDSTADEPCWSVLRQITVEPVVILMFACSGMLATFNNALLYRKIEQAIGTTLELDSNHSWYENEGEVRVRLSLDDEIHREFSIYSSYTSSTIAILSCVSMIILGGLSHLLPSRLLLLLPIFGCICYVGLCIAVALVDSLPLIVLVVASGVFGLSGGWGSMFAFSSSYAIQRFGGHHTTTRIAVLQGAQTAANALGSFISGTFLENCGFTIVYSVCLGMCTSAFFYILLCLKENEDHKISLGLPCEIWRGFRDFHPADDLYAMVNRNLISSIADVTIQFGCLFVIVCTLIRDPMIFIFLTHRPLYFSILEYSFFKGISMLSVGASLLLLVPLMKQLFFLDWSLLLLGQLASLLVNVLLAVSFTPLMAYIGSAINGLSQLSFVALQGLLSSRFPLEKQGKLFAAVSFMYDVAVAVQALLCSAVIYPATMDYMPGCMFAIAAAFSLLPMGCAIFHLIRHRQMKEEDDD